LPNKEQERTSRCLAKELAGHQVVFDFR
jgi:hypothetical protein